MANFTSTFDLINSSLSRVGELSDGTSPFQSKALEYINQIYFSILSGSNEFNLDLGEPWVWAKAQNPGVLTLLPPYNTGSVTLTNGSTAGTFSSAPSVSLQGTYLKMDGIADFFRITAHTASTTSFTIDSAYTGSTASGLLFNAFYLDYALSPNILRMIGPLHVYQRQIYSGDEEGKIYSATLEALLRDYPMHLLRKEVPTRFAVRFDSKIGIITLRMNSYVDTQVKVEFDYIPYHPDLVNFQFTDSSVSTGSDTITINNHGQADTSLVYLNNNGGSLPVPFTSDTPYYVVSSTTNTLKLALTEGGTPIDITAATGGGTHFLSNVPVLPRETRPVLDYAVTTWLMSDKNDARVQNFFQMTQQKLESMVKASRKQSTHTGKNKGQIMPRLDQMPMKSIVARSP